MPGTIKILIADDHDVVRAGIRNILGCQPNWDVVGEACNGREAIQRSLETNPDIAILDYSMPYLSGLEVTRQIRAQQTGTEILIFTMHRSESLAQDLLKAGALGYVLKSDAGRYLIGAIEAVSAHKPFFTLAEASKAGPPFGADCRSITALTSREHSVVHLIAEGYANKQIANVLRISPKTVETHRAAVMRKLDLSSTASLVRYAVRNGILHA